METTEQISYCSEWGNWLGIGYIDPFYGELISEELKYDEVQEQHYMLCVWKK